MVYVNRLLWDPGNVGHIARHAVTPEEVEQVCHGRTVALAGGEGRLALVGPTEAGRVLVVVLEMTVDMGVYDVVTARPASRRERRIYTTRDEEGELQ